MTVMTPWGCEHPCACSCVEDLHTANVALRARLAEVEGERDKAQADLSEAMMVIDPFADFVSMRPQGGFPGHSLALGDFNKARDFRVRIRDEQKHAILAKHGAANAD